MIPFNKPHLTGKEDQYILDGVRSGKISGNGGYTKRCQQYFEEKFGFGKCLLTTSCTDALEMCAILLDIQPGDEVIMPSFTFVSTANAFVLRGARIVFTDSGLKNPNLDPKEVESLISDKTKAIVVVHYAGVACDMDNIMAIANKHNIKVVEDAAQAVDSYFKERPLGSIGHLAAFSFHETKNIISGEGGMLVINDMQYAERSEIIWEKGTNRSAFFRGETDKYGWVDIGSSFLPSDIVAAFLFAQLENLEDIQAKRKAIWERYFNELLRITEKGIQLPFIPDYATNNGHMFYFVCNSLEERSALLKHLKDKNILAVFHYQSLHESEYFNAQHDDRKLSETYRYTHQLVRLPLYYDLTEKEQSLIIDSVLEFYS